MDEIKIIEPIRIGLNHFKTTDEFSIYYAKHKNEMNEMTTQKLNKQFKIDGYRITKIGTRDDNGKRQQGNICLKKIKPNNTKNNNESIDFTTEIAKINERIDALTKTINSIISALNEE